MATVGVPMLLAGVFPSCEECKFKCSCRTKTAVHGGEDKKCKLYGSKGNLRYMGYDMEVPYGDILAAREFYPRLKLV